MKLKEIIWEELVDHISIDEETFRTVVRTTIENMDLKYMVFGAIRDCLNDEIEQHVNEIIDDVVEQTIDSELE